MANEEAPNEKILDKIRKLLALSTSSNEYEAALAASKAQELLLKYNLEMSQLKQDVGDEIERWNFRTPFRDSWLSYLMGAVASANLCRVVQGGGWKTGRREWENGPFTAGERVREFYLFGKKPNLEVTEFMYEYLAAEIDRLTPRKGAKYVSSFRIGAVTTIDKRLKEELKTFQSTEETRALIVVSDAALAVKVKEAFPKLTKGKGASITDYAGYLDGQAAGKSIQFRQGVSGKNPAGQALLGG